MFVLCVPQAEYKQQLEEMGDTGQFSVSQAERSSKAAVLENEQDIKVGYVVLVNSALVFINSYVRSGQVRSECRRPKARPRPQCWRTNRT